MTKTLNSFAALAEEFSRKDTVDIQSGYMAIYPEHLNTYLSKYACKDFEDLQDTLYTKCGVFVKLID